MKTKPLAILAAVLLAGCATPDAEFAARIRAHVAPMAPIYLHGVDTFPGATEADKVVYRRHLTQLDKLLSTTQPAVAK